MRDRDEPVRIGVAGLGTVGTSLVNLLHTHESEIASKAGRPVRVTAVSARDRSRDRGIPLDGYEWFDNPVELAHTAGIDVFVELIGGEAGAALEAVSAALDAKKPVVTANKALLAAHGMHLAERSEQGSMTLAYEAAVAGGIPVIKVLRESLAGNRISRIYGILNGTCNYILSRMEDEGLTFEACLKDAQRLGYAEADPTFDVDGIDTAHKLAILTSLAFGTRIDKDSIFVEGIASIRPEDIAAADELGYRIRLLGVAQATESGIEQRVHPTMVPRDSEIARITGVTNAIAIEGDFVGAIVLAGPGAGGNATASAVAADIVDIARGATLPTFGRSAKSLEPYKRARMRAHEGGYYLRLLIPDRPGAFAAIAADMAEAGISLESIVQRSRPIRTSPQGDPHEFQPVTIITHDTTEQSMRDALDMIVARGGAAQAPQMIRIEKL